MAALFAAIIFGMFTGAMIEKTDLYDKCESYKKKPKVCSSK